MGLPIATFPSSLQLTRSPIYITLAKGTAVNDGLIDATLTLRIFAGSSASSPTANYTLYKTSIDNGTIVFEISDLIREDITSVLKNGAINDWETATTEVVWCKFTLSATYSLAGAAPETGLIESNKSFLCSDGWLPFTQQSGGIVAGAGLLTNRTMQVYDGYEQSLPALYDTNTDLNGVLYNVNGTDYFYVLSDELGFANTSTQSTQKVIYIPAGPASVDSFLGVQPTGDYTISLISDSAAVNYKARVEADGGTCEGFACLRAALAELGYEENATDYNYELVCEPKYTPVLVTFINRFGVSDFITFFKVSTRAGSFTRSQYMPQLNGSGYNVAQQVQYQKFDINSKEVIALNTGWVDENYDDVLRELLMSESVSVNYEGSTFTVNPADNAIQYQKNINDKNINYTLSFEIGWDIRNNVR
jgi:hypothetical protein